MSNHLKTSTANSTQSGGETLMRQTAYERIEVLLNTGKLTPGQLVSQRELVELTGSTLGSIREAITRFVAEGLLQSLPKRGLMVPSLDISFVRNAYGLRRLLELGALDRAFVVLPKSTVDNWISEHEKLRDRLNSTPSETIFKTVQELDWDIHTQLVAAENNDLVNNVYRTTAIKIRMAAQSRIQVTPFNALRVINEHLDFLRPLADGDIELCRNKLDQHINNSLTLALGGTV